MRTLLILVLTISMFGCASRSWHFPWQTKPPQHSSDQPAPKAQSPDTSADNSDAAAAAPAETPESVQTPTEGQATQDATPQTEPLALSTDETAAAEDALASNSEASAVPPVVTEAPAGKAIQETLDEALDFCQVAQESWQSGDLDNALEALDQAYALILQVDTEDNPKLIQQKEDLRFLISKRILEIHASRNIVVNGNHNAIPLTMNRYVETEIKRFTGIERRFFIESYHRSGRYRTMIVEALREAGLPEELSWVPLIESGYKVKALSRARALGLWQFIPSTGYKFGLKRDIYVDARLDPVKATHAAVAYLKELHQIFGDWTTVLAAYNCGEGRVLRVIRSQNVNYLDNFWDLYERLPRETARYVPRFLATLHILKNPERYGMAEALRADEPLVYETVSVNRRVHLKHLAGAIQSTEKTLVTLNPQLRYRILPEREFTLNVPPGSGVKVLAAIDQLPLSSRPSRPFVYHRVRSGQTLSTIARRYRASVRAIMSANGIRRSSFIRAGKTLKIPLRGPRVSRTVASSGNGKPLACPPATPKDGKHIVSSGDSLWIIARRYGTTVAKIQKANKLRSGNLSIGQHLVIPDCEPEPVQREGLKQYTVKSGDSPFAIAKRHQMTLGRFLRINRISPGHTIYPGQTLYVE